MMTERCKDCLFSAMSKSGDTLVHVCRGNPPTPIAIPAQNPSTGQVQVGIQAVWPPIDPEHDYCGLFDDGGDDDGDDPEKEPLPIDVDIEDVANDDQEAA